MTAEFPSLAGHFLIAMPALTEGFFEKSVVYLLAHDAEGALGIVINQHSGLMLSDVLEQLKPEQLPLADERNPDIYSGGPVQTELGFVLHTTGTDFQGTTEFGELSLTASQDAILAVAQGTAPERSLIALGHSGWSAGQLEEELAANAWLTCKADHKVIFDTPIEERRSAAAALLGVDLNRLSHQVGHA